MQYEVSSGAIVFTRKDNDIYFVIVKSLEGFYGFPKGHIEAYEEMDLRYFLKTMLVSEIKIILQHLDLISTLQCDIFMVLSNPRKYMHYLQPIDFPINI